MTQTKTARGQLAAALAGFVLSALAVAIAVANVSPWVAGARAAMVALPVAIGLYAWRRRPDEPFGKLLVVVGLAWFPTTLAESDTEVLYSIGRVSGWIAEALIIYLALSFPTGRITTRVDRTLVYVTVGLVALFYLPSALISEGYPSPSPYSSCHPDCPENAFFILGSEPGFVESVLEPLRGLLTFALFTLVTLRLGQRMLGATRLMRLTLAPVLVVAALRSGLMVAALLTRSVTADSAALADICLILALCLPGMALGFLVGLFSWRLHAADSLQRLGQRLRPSMPRGELRLALADTLDDPSLEVAYWLSRPQERWVDANGRPLDAPAASAERCVTMVNNGPDRVAAIVHDGALADQEEFVDAVAAYALIALENERLGARLDSSLREVQASRARMVIGADEERRRIERDLHDGAQQRLVALRVQLELVEDLLHKDPERGFEKLHSLGASVETTIDEIRSISRGVYPSLLADRGLADALRSAAIAAPIVTEVSTDGAEHRYPHEIESAIYFCCLEALQNASKHAEGAALVKISLTNGEGLSFEVRDDGAGFNMGEASGGAGLTNMHDRLAAVGGTVRITSASGEGTLVKGNVPVPHL